MKATTYKLPVIDYHTVKIENSAGLYKITFEAFECFNRKRRVRLDFAEDQLKNLLADIQYAKTTNYQSPTI
jgi:hypothetical protein